MDEKDNLTIEELEALARITGRNDAALKIRKKIKKKDFVKLCKMQCTCSEIASFFEVKRTTLRNFCLREYKMPLDDFRNMHAEAGIISLRRVQWRNAMKTDNTQMQIWLGKQFLNQTDKRTVDSSEAEEKLGKLLADISKNLPE